MNEKLKLAILIIAGVLIFAIGVGLGIVIQTKTGMQKIKDEVVGNFSSKVVSSITAYGKVIKIEGRNITLSYLGDSLAASISNSAKVYSFATATSPQEEVGFEALKTGDNINAILRLLPDGRYEGSSIIIFPPAAATK